MTWKKVPLGTLVLSSQYGLSLPSSAHGDIPIIGMKDIQDGCIRIDPDVRVSLSPKDIDDFILCEGDVLINRTNSPDLVGKAGIFRGPERAVFASYLVRFVLDQKKVDPEFVIQILNSEGGQREIKRLATRAVSQANLNPSVLKKNFMVPLPTLEEQRRIREMLREWDVAVHKVNALVSRKDELKSGLMASLLTGECRVSGFNSQWSRWRLRDLFEERVETNRQGLPLLSITREEGVIYRDNTERRDISSYDKSSYLRICPGDIGYNTMRMWQGVSAISPYEGIVSPAYTVCIPSPHIDGGFAAQLFKLPQMIHVFYRYSQGLTSDTWNLKFHHFGEIQVSIPPVDEQMAIASVLARVDAELALLKREKVALSRQKRGLIQKLLAGYWYVANNGT